MVETIIIILVGVGSFLIGKFIIKKKNSNKAYKAEVKKQTGVTLPTSPTVPVEDKAQKKEGKFKK